MFLSISLTDKRKVKRNSVLLISFWVFQTLSCNSVYAFQLIATKPPNLKTPTEDKLTSKDADSSTSDDRQSEAKSSLAPINLSEDKQERVTQSSGLDLSDRAKKVNIAPMTLMKSDKEEEQAISIDLECEKRQISALWEATLNRSPDIQFVVQKLLPSSDKRRTTTILMRMISSSLTSIAGTTPVITGPNPFTVISSQFTSNAFNQIVDLHESKLQKREQIDQAQAIMLYQMVRGIADKVTEYYRDYKFRVRSIDTTQVRAQKLQNLVKETRIGQDAVKQIEMEYWLDRVRTEIEEAVYVARRYRQSLVDLAGAEAVYKLDQDLQDQLLTEKEVETGTNKKH
ncbi:MAG: hypothetical protein K2Y39_16665 [Candidatus Obscuribacterales bacterium]|nr:hypothetical protein [Candidatus Obscuribacterales bacterium]